MAARAQVAGRGKSQRGNVWPFSRSKPAKCATPRSSMTIPQAVKAAHKAGADIGDTGLFEDWLCKTGLHARGGPVKTKLRKSFAEGVEGGNGDGAATSPMSQYKGVGIHRTGDEYYTDLDPETRFEDVKLAKAFIGEWKKRGNPEGGVFSEPEYEAAVYAGRDRAKELRERFGSTRIAPEALVRQFEIWWEYHKNDSSVERKDKAGNKRNWMRGFKWGAKPSNPSPSSLDEAFIGEWKKAKPNSGVYLDGIKAGREAAGVFNDTVLEDVKERLHGEMQEHQSSLDRYSQGFMTGWREVSLRYARAGAGNPSPSGSGKDWLIMFFNLGYVMPFGARRTEKAQFTRDPNLAETFTLEHARDYTAMYQGQAIPMSRQEALIVWSKYGKKSNPSGSGKEPWRMTQREYCQFYRANYREEQSRVGSFPNLAHKNEVRKALESGKPVPPEVLADYPDLRKGNPYPDLSQRSESIALARDVVSKMFAAGLIADDGARVVEMMVRRMSMSESEAFDVVNEAAEQGTPASGKAIADVYKQRLSTPERTKAAKQIADYRIEHMADELKPGGKRHKEKRNPARNGHRLLTAALIPQRTADGPVYRVAPIEGPEGIIKVPGAFPSKAQAERTTMAAIRGALRHLSGTYSVQFPEAS